jgi:hypothetical protein
MNQAAAAYNRCLVSSTSVLNALWGPFTDPTVTPASKAALFDIDSPLAVQAQHRRAIIEAIALLFARRESATAPLPDCPLDPGPGSLSRTAAVSAAAQARETGVVSRPSPSQPAIPRVRP